MVICSWRQEVRSRRLRRRLADPLSTNYHTAENEFERFREFWELISRFEFDFCRCGIF